LMLLKRNLSQTNLEKLLSDEHKKRTVEKFKKYTKLRIGENPDKHAAILIPICITADNEISLLYTIRSSKLRNHSGQVCFPGNFCCPLPDPDIKIFVLIIQVEKWTILIIMKLSALFARRRKK
jgi:hypothetical protein